MARCSRVLTICPIMRSMTRELHTQMLTSTKANTSPILSQLPSLPLTIIRRRSGLPYNFGLVFVRQQEAWVVERMGKFYTVLNPGPKLLIPILDQIKYVQSLKEIAIEVPQQSAITVDNVALHIDGVLYLRVVDPYKASYGVEDPQFAITQLAQTTMRSEVGKIMLDTVFRERETLNVHIVESLNKAALPWGIQCMRYEIRDMQMPPKIREAMQMQVEAERKKRAKVLESEGVRDAEINVAEGKKRATVLSSEARREEQINMATGEASAIRARAEARASAINVVATAIGAKGGSNAASFAVAEQYIKEFGKLAKTTNTLILPAQTGDVSSMVTQALTVYKTLMKENVTNKRVDDGGNKNESVSDDKDELHSDDDILPGEKGFSYKPQKSK